MQGDGAAVACSVEVQMALVSEQGTSAARWQLMHAALVTIQHTEAACSPEATGSPAVVIHHDLCLDDFAELLEVRLE
jgi:hypothetical protein